MRRVVDFIFVFVFALFLTACGGGGAAPISDDSSNSPSAVNLNGIAVDNYISGATVCIDTNKNNNCSDESASNKTTTLPDGTFSFSNVIPAEDMVIIAYGGTDTVTGVSFPYIIKNIATNKDSNNKIILSSLNTLITDYKFETNSTLAQARSAIQTFISSSNLEKTISDVMLDKNSSEFFKSLKVFQMVASINDANNSTESAESFKAIAKAIADNSTLRDTNSSIAVTVNSQLKTISSSIYKPVFLKDTSDITQYFDPNYPALNSTFNFFEVYDPKDNNITYTLSNVLDNNLFNINSSGVISFKSLPTTIINPNDLDGDGIYEVEVKISNTLNFITKIVKIEVKHTGNISIPILNNTIVNIDDNGSAHPVGASIGSVQLASNNDPSGIIKYESNSSGGNIFDINWTSGNIYRKGTLPDVTTMQTEILTVRAKNSAGWSADKNVTINIYNTGELNSTATIANETFSIYENNSSFPTVGQVTVTSTGGHTITDFNITSGGDDFNISSSGIITAKRSFNFENEPTHTLKVVAKNENGWGNEATITVNILDVNEVPYVTGSTVSNNVMADQNVSFEETKTLSFALNDGDTEVTQNISIDVNSSNTGIVTVSKSISSGYDSNAFDVNITGNSPGTATITVKVQDANGTENGGIDTKIYTFNATVRSNGWKYYDERSNSNEHNISFDGITYTWKPDKQWYETATTILMPVQILKSAKSAYLAGNFKEVAEGHYYVNKSEYIWDVNKSQTHTTSMLYKNANGVDNNVTANNNNFQHDAYHNFFVSMITVDGNGEVKSKKYNEWTNASSNFMDANDTNQTYGTARNLSIYHDTSSDQAKQIDANNTNISITTECAKMYGKGWRIPTAYEVGIENASELVLLVNHLYGYIPAYVGNTSDKVFSSTKNGTQNQMLSLQLLSNNNDSNSNWTGVGYDNGAHLRCIYQP